MSAKEMLFPLQMTKRSVSGSAAIMFCKTLMLLLLNNLMMLVAKMLACFAGMMRALLLGTLAMLATKSSSASKSDWHLCINMKKQLLQMCNRLLACARACVMEVHAVEVARGLRGELAGAHRLSGLPTGQAFDASGPEGAAGSDAAERVAGIF